MGYHLNQGSKKAPFKTLTLNILKSTASNSLSF